MRCAKRLSADPNASSVLSALAADAAGSNTETKCDPPETGRRQFGYSRDKRSDCVQVVIALIVTPEGFPLAYEVLNGNTGDKTTLPVHFSSVADL